MMMVIADAMVTLLMMVIVDVMVTHDDGDSGRDGDS